MYRQEHLRQVLDTAQSGLLGIAETILRMRQESPVPPDFDWENAREEAMLEKYGHFIECFGSVTNLKHPQDRR